MGVRGLTTFIANRSSQYLDHFELHDSYLVIDGNSIACQLYKWHCKSNDCFGGDYDKYAHVVTDFCQLLFDCNITPLVIFDGAYEKRKMKTIYSRIKNRISSARDLNSVTEGRVSVFPLLMRELFVDILLKMKVQCVKCDFEGDNDAAQLARSLQCPLVSYDSDFYIFDVLYIPFSNMELKLRKRKNFNYVACDVYRVDKFLNSFGGLDKVNLPLLAVLLGNDYIKKRAFSAFYRQLKMCKTKQNEQQTQIKSVIVWLKNETPESALRKILGRYKLRFRKRLAKRIEKAIEAYQSGNTPVATYFNIDVPSSQSSVIVVPKPEEVESLGEEEIDSDEDSSAEGTPEEEEDDDSNGKTQCVLKYAIPTFFRENFRKCLYPACFLDMIVSKTYFCIVQIEDFSSEYSHAISIDILAAMYKILTFPQTRRLICVARNENAHIKKFTVPPYEKEVPKLTEIENMDRATSMDTLLNILNISETTLDEFPNSWHLFLLSLKYWVTNSKTKIELPCIYSIIICGVVLHYVDSKVGFYRSTKSFVAKYSSNSPMTKLSETPKNITEALNEIDANSGVACMKKLIHYFQMDAKMRSYVKLFDRNIIHELAKFQSVLLHVKYLNSLLNFPFPTFVISDFYDGTFVYNMTTNLQKRGDLKSYMKLLLEDCPKILSLFEMMMIHIEDEIIISNVSKHEPPRKKRRKKRPTKDVVPEVAHSGTEEEEYAFDANNKYSLLSFINK